MLPLHQPDVTLLLQSSNGSRHGLKTEQSGPIVLLLKRKKA